MVHRHSTAGPAPPRSPRRALAWAVGLSLGLPAAAAAQPVGPARPVGVPPPPPQFQQPPRPPWFLIAQPWVIAIAPAAAAAVKQQRDHEEEEDMAAFPSDSPPSFEYKIIRSATGQFKNLARF